MSGKVPELRQLYPDPGKKNAIPTNFDIIAIHGLFGDLIETWTAKTGYMWIQDCLPEVFPTARIFTYGYDTGSLFMSNKVVNVNTVADDLLEHLERERKSFGDPNSRPFLFICHSLGGIIFKLAILSANDDSDKYRWLLDAPKAVVFMGTPHFGSRVATFWERFTAVTPGFNRQFTKLLKSHSEELERLSQRFTPHAAKLKYIFSFYEGVVHPKIRKLIVDQHSAIMQVANGKWRQIAATHQEMCKFTGKEDLLFTNVLFRVEEIVYDPDKLNVERQAGYIAGLSSSTSNLLQSQVSAPSANPQALTWRELEALNLAVADNAYAGQNFDEASQTYTRILQRLGALQESSSPSITQNQNQNHGLSFFVLDRLARCALNRCLSIRLNKEQADAALTEAKKIYSEARKLTQNHNWDLGQAENRAWLTGFCIRGCEARVYGRVDDKFLVEMNEESLQGLDRVMRLKEVISEEDNDARSQVDELINDIKQARKSVVKWSGGQL